MSPSVNDFPPKSTVVRIHCDFIIWIEECLKKLLEIDTIDVQLRLYDWVFAEESMFDSRPLNKYPNNSIQALCPLPLHILMWSSYVISFLFPNIHY